MTLQDVPPEFEHYERLLKNMNWEYESLYPADKKAWRAWKEIDIYLRKLRSKLYGLDPENPTKSAALYAKYSGGGA
jgi:hypothetical protein